MKHIRVELNWKLVEGAPIKAHEKGIFIYTFGTSEDPPFYTGCEADLKLLSQHSKEPGDVSVFYSPIAEVAGVPYAELLRSVEERLQEAIRAVSEPSAPPSVGDLGNCPFSLEVCIASAHVGWVLENASLLNRYLEYPLEFNKKPAKRVA